MAVIDWNAYPEKALRVHLAGLKQRLALTMASVISVIFVTSIILCEVRLVNVTKAIARRMVDLKNCMVAGLRMWV